MSDQDTPNTEQEQSTIDVDKLVEALKNVTREDGSQKYNDPVKAIESLQPANEHIARLSEENQEMRRQLAELTQQVSSQQTGDEIVDKILSQLNAPKEQSGIPTAADNSGEDLRELVRREVTQLTREERTAANRRTFVEKASAKVSDINKAVESSAKTLGISTGYLLGIIESSPDAAMKLMGLDTKENLPVKMKSSVSQDSLTEPQKTSVKPNLSTTAGQVDFYKRLERGEIKMEPIDLNKL